MDTVQLGMVFIDHSVYKATINKKCCNRRRIQHCFHGTPIVSTLTYLRYVHDLCIDSPMPLHGHENVRRLSYSEEHSYFVIQLLQLSLRSLWDFHRDLNRSQLITSVTPSHFLATMQDTIHSSYAFARSLRYLNMYWVKAPIPRSRSRENHYESAIKTPTHSLVGHGVTITVF